MITERHGPLRGKAQWVVLARIWLPLTGRLPWAVMTFLDDAYERDILRQTGAVYQFRHALLQDHLVNSQDAVTGNALPGCRAKVAQSVAGS